MQWISRGKDYPNFISELYRVGYARINAISQPLITSSIKEFQTFQRVGHFAPYPSLAIIHVEQYLILNSSPHTIKMPSSTHQAKRPYGGSHGYSQSTITSYFPSTTLSRDEISDSSNPYSSEPVSSSTPYLPASVQSNLLSVGMRVRKSVPEGYKTGSYSAFTLFSDTICAPLEPKPLIRRTYQSRRKELTPFCGIMKVGGLAQQEYVEEYEEVLEEDDIPFLCSQGSTISDVSVTSLPPNKRRHESDDEDGGGLWRMEESPLTSSLFRSGSEMDLGSRVMAKPKTRRKGIGGYDMKGKGGDTQTGDQENVVMDFEEADFLDFGWRGTEVDMRDV